MPFSAQFHLNIGLFCELDAYNHHVSVGAPPEAEVAGGARGERSAESPKEIPGVDVVMSPETNSRAAAAGCPFAKYAAQSQRSPTFTDLKCQRFAAADRRARTAISARMWMPPLAMVLALLSIALSLTVWQPERVEQTGVPMAKRVPQTPPHETRSNFWKGQRAGAPPGQPSSPGKEEGIR